MRYFAHLTVLVWVAALVATAYLPGIPSSSIVIVTSLMLLFERWMHYRAGEEFARRVKRVVDDTVSKQHSRLTELERVVGDVREAQVRSGAAYRGGAGRI